MTIYVPNIGEKEMLKAILRSHALVLGLYRNQVLPDGNTTVDILQEMPTGGGRGYERKALSNDVVEDGNLQSGKWRVTTNSQGRAEAQYSNVPLEWTFNAADADDMNTVYGFFGFTWVLPFNQGSGEIRVGDTVTGATSGAEGVVTAVFLQSGGWAGGDAAGVLCLKGKTGTFQNGENLQVGGVTKAVSNTGLQGDAHRRLMLLEPLSEGYVINQAGQKITYVPKITLSTAT